MSSLEDVLGPLASRLRCLQCGSALELLHLSPTPGYPQLGADGRLGCVSCDARYPLIGGTPRMLTGALAGDLRARYPLAGDAFEAGAAVAPLDAEQAVKRATADSFAYEWQHFGELRAQWQQNFADYMRPRTPAELAGKVILDVGAGSGRHSFHAAQAGASVVAVDLGGAIDVARANLPANVLTVQADAEALPFDTDSFDMVMSIGVLHHLPDPQRALASVARFAARGGIVHVYLYWLPGSAWQRSVLSAVGALRRVTVRLPRPLLRALCYPLAVVLYACVVAPYGALRSRRRTRGLAAALPLKTYADYPFGVLVNDQFDRFSAPIEHRYTREQVRDAMRACELVEIEVLANHGWVADGRRPA